MLRDGAKTRHADARRIRVFDFDIFFFGTGIWLPCISRSEGRSGRFSRSEGRSGPGA
jgi:hypothetical protein